MGRSTMACGRGPYLRGDPMSVANCVKTNGYCLGMNLYAVKAVYSVACLEWGWWRDENS